MSQLQATLPYGWPFLFRPVLGLLWPSPLQGRKPVYLLGSLLNKQTGRTSQRSRRL